MKTHQYLKILIDLGVILPVTLFAQVGLTRYGAGSGAGYQVSHFGNYAVNKVPANSYLSTSFFGHCFHIFAKLHL